MLKLHWSLFIKLESRIFFSSAIYKIDEEMSESDYSIYLGGLIVRRVEAFHSDLSEDVGLQRLLRQVTVVNDG